MFYKLYSGLDKGFSRATVTFVCRIIIESMFFPLLSSSTMSNSDVLGYLFLFPLSSPMSPQIRSPFMIIWVSISRPRVSMKAGLTHHKYCLINYSDLLLKSRVDSPVEVDDSNALSSFFSRFAHAFCPEFQCDDKQGGILQCQWSLQGFITLNTNI